MNEDDLKAIKELWQGTTPNPWAWNGNRVFQGNGPWIADFAHELDALAVSSAPTDIAALIAEVRRLRDGIAYALPRSENGEYVGFILRDLLEKSQ